MKNKFYLVYLLISLLFLFSLNRVLAKDLVIDAEVLDIKDKGEIIKASGSISIKDGNKIQITGNEATYDKIKNIIEINGNVFFYDKIRNYQATSNKIIFNRDINLISSFGKTKITFLNENLDTILEVNGKNSFFDQNKRKLEIRENVLLNDYQNNTIINSEHIVYNNQEEIIKSLGNTKINYNNNYLIQTKDISFEKNQRKFFSDKETTVTDNDNNKFLLSSFYFDIEEKILKAQYLKLNDSEKNELELKNGYIDLKTNELVGSDFNFIFNKETFGNSENDPRLVGRYIISNKSKTSMKKSSFTTCKNIKGKCPAWSISAEEVNHLKEKKRIEYKNTWLKIYDVPVAYFPYFFHPDPEVERQSGFLFPQFINSSNLGFSTQLPYFKVIDKDKDMTISPRLYNNNNLFVQTEYRQAFKDSSLITDLSYNKKNDTNLHFFTKLRGDFDDSFYEMKIETVSNKDYLKKYQITSPLIKNQSVLNSSFIIETYNNEYNFSSSIDIIEDLAKSDSDKYEYIFPNYKFSKQISLKNNFFNSLNFNSSGTYRKFNTNVDEGDLINDIILNSNNQNQFSNLQKDFNFLLKNTNSYGDKSPTYKDDKDSKLFGSVIMNFEYPLIKNNNISKSFLTPKTSLRFSPNKGLNLKNENKNILNFQDLFIIDRIGNNTVESGTSATVGLEYKKIDNLKNDKLRFGLAVNLRNNKDDDLPVSSSLGEKTSDLIGYSGLNITENLTLNYNFSLDQNLKETNYSLLSAIYNNNRFKTSFEYMEKSNHVGDESYLNNFTELQIDKSNSIAFETNKNIDKNLTNYYNLIYEYKNDCLKASVVYNKQFYQEDSINSGKNIFFKISFIPFGDINTPNLK